MTCPEDFLNVSIASLETQLLEANKTIASLESTLRELRMALDPDDWMGDVRMIDFIDAALREGK